MTFGLRRPADDRVRHFISNLRLDRQAPERAVREERYLSPRDPGIAADSGSRPADARSKSAATGQPVD